MNLITICFLLPIIFFGDETASDVQIEHHSYQYTDSSYVLYNVTEHIISNNSSNKSYVTFICSDFEETNPENVIIRYFCSPSKSFNLMTLLTDNVVINEFIPTIGKTFLKEVKPGNDFKYTMLEKLLVKDSMHSDMCIIVVEKEYIETLLKVSLIDKFFFKNDELIISGKGN